MKALNHFTLVLTTFFLAHAALAQPTPPLQPGEGPGGSDYRYEEVFMTDSAREAGGFWLFEPKGAHRDTAGLVVFFPGFGCYNPMIYGQWVRHLVLKGHIVVMPRYQDGLLRPRSKDFFQTAASGIRRALAHLKQNSEVPIFYDRPVLIGHSYGATLAAQCAMEWETCGLQVPAGLMACQMGVNLFRGGRIRDWNGFPDSLQILIVEGKGDLFVGGRSSKRLHRAAPQAGRCERLLLRPDRHGSPSIRSGHRSCHAPYPAFDNGVRTFSAWYALHRVRTDAADFFGYWKWSEALIDCSLMGVHCEWAFGGTETQLSLGRWSDSIPVRRPARMEK
jgi:pimeloyl-ACP methyl ester carboxylesterase